MSVLRDRIVHTGRTQTDATYVYPSPRTPNVYLEPGAVVDSGMPYPSGKQAAYSGPGFTRAIPVVHIGVYPGRVGYQETTHLDDPTGLSVPPTRDGEWGQLYRAGRIFGQ